MIETVRHWASQREDVRAVLLTSTRTIPNYPLDPFSDYDVIIAVTDILPYFNDRQWLETFGSVLVLYRDPLRGEDGLRRFAYITNYETNRLKIDITIMEIGLLQQIADAPQLPDELDVGYEVLLDKDTLTQNLMPPTYQAFMPKPPTADTFAIHVEEFLHESLYVGKNLWRAELLPAQYSLHVLRHSGLRTVLEWYAGVDNNWSVKTGSLGKGLQQKLPADVWTQLEKTYASADSDTTWDALFIALDLFRTTAQVVARALDYTYPEATHQRVLDQLTHARTFDG